MFSYGGFSMIGKVRSYARQIRLAVILSWKDLVDGYKGSVLGGLWAVFNPLSQILIFALVFSKFMGARLPELADKFTHFGYSVYLISGLLVWNFFAGSLTGGANVFFAKRGIVSKVRSPLRLFPLSNTLTNFYIFVISVLFFLVFLLLVGGSINYKFLYLFPMILLLFLFSFYLGSFFALLGLYVQDVKEILNIFVQVGFWFTPIVYTKDILPHSIQSLIYFNPIYWWIESMRGVVLYNEAPDKLFWVYAIVVVFASYVISSFFYKKLESDARDII
ncbi:ABC transporter permease [Balneatrix alpica]|uniref:Transport permease protein n=1 Tax=Balneatrix alpica TaxID=75684 RepID=A0ABV5ZAV7_9GAMM|nr:ABC transporter permease [Balneatrix alpica]